MSRLYRWFRLLLLVPFIVLILVWHRRNEGVVPIDFFWDSVQLPLSIALLLALVAGVGSGLLAGAWSSYRLRRKNRHLQKRIAKLEKIPVVSSGRPLS